PQLEKVLADPKALPEQKLRARLALLPDPRHVPELRESMLEADAADFAIIRDALAPLQAQLIEPLWEELQATRGNSERRFRAAAARARYDPDSPRCAGVAPPVAGQLAAQPALALPKWVEALRPVKDRLVPPLAVILRDRSTLPTTSAAAAELVGDYASDRSD